MNIKITRPELAAAVSPQPFALTSPPTFVPVPYLYPETQPAVPGIQPWLPGPVWVETPWTIGTYTVTPPQ